VDHFHGDSRQRMADPSAPGCDLPEPRRAIIASVDGYYRRAFGAAITFEWANAEHVLKCHGDALLQLLGADQDVHERAEALRRAASHVRLQKCGSRHHECDLVSSDKRTDGLRVERIGMVHHTNAVYCRQP